MKEVLETYLQDALFIPAHWFLVELLSNLLIFLGNRGLKDKFCPKQLGLDVFVHGEAERNDMVEYFGEQLAGYGFFQIWQHGFFLFFL